MGTTIRETSWWTAVSHVTVATMVHWSMTRHSCTGDTARAEWGEGVIGFDVQGITFFLTAKTTTFEQSKHSG